MWKKLSALQRCCSSAMKMRKKIPFASGTRCCGTQNAQLKSRISRTPTMQKDVKYAIREMIIQIPHVHLFDSYHFLAYESSESTFTSCFNGT